LVAEPTRVRVLELAAHQLRERQLRSSGASGVQNLFRHRLSHITRAGTGRSNRIVAAILVDVPPVAAAGELTEKGTVNGLQLLKNRQALLEALYSEGNTKVLFG
jgi:hypothetical protein